MSQKPKEVQLDFQVGKPIDREALIGGLINLAGIIRQDTDVKKLSIRVKGARKKWVFDLV